MKYLLILLIIFAKPNIVDGITIQVHHEVYIGDKPVAQVKEADSRPPLGKKNRAIRPLKSDGASPTPTVALPTSPIKDRLATATISAFGAEHVEALTSLVFRESGFNPKAQNGSSGACGLFQAMPCAKMGCSLEDVDCQIAWGFGYIKRRYGNPSKAWAHWLRAEPINGKNVGHWY